MADDEDNDRNAVVRHPQGLMSSRSDAIDSDAPSDTVSSTCTSRSVCTLPGSPLLLLVARPVAPPRNDVVPEALLLVVTLEEGLMSAPVSVRFRGRHGMLS